MSRASNPIGRLNPTPAMIRRFTWMHVNDAIADGKIRSYQSAYSARYKDEKAGIVGRFWTRYDGLYINSNYPKVYDSIAIEELYFKLADKLGATNLYREIAKLTGWRFNRIYCYFRTFRFDRESTMNKYYEVLKQIDKNISM